MKARTKIAFVALTVVLLLSAFLFTGVAQGAPAKPSVRILVSGNEFGLVKGQILADAALQDCKIVVRGKPGSYFNHCDIEVACENGKDLIIKDISFSHQVDAVVPAEAQAVSSGESMMKLAALTSGADLHGYAQQEIHCPFHQRSFRTYSSLDYYDSGSSVEAYHAYRYAYASPFGEVLDWGSEIAWGPAQVSCWTWGEFDSSAPRNQYHVQETTFIAWPGQDWEAVFWLSRMPDWITWPVTFHRHLSSGLSYN